VIHRQVRRVEIAPGMVRYRVLITGEDCPINTNEAKIHQTLFLDWLMDNKEMLNCGYQPFQKMSIRHNGTSWQAELEAEVEEPTDQ
jgi:hypothetical protein